MYMMCMKAQTIQDTRPERWTPKALAAAAQLPVLVGTQPDMNLVAEASNGSEAIQQFRTRRPTSR